MAFVGSSLFTPVTMLAVADLPGATAGKHSFIAPLPLAPTLKRLGDTTVGRTIVGELREQARQRAVERRVLARPEDAGFFARLPWKEIAAVGVLGGVIVYLASKS